MNTYTVLLSGNPNVGKSTIFNALTGLHQHTGNWSGKTVGSAQGEFYTEGQRFILVDLPGTYSLTASSADEEVTRDALCFSQPDAVILVADATCLERSLDLCLQTAEAVRCPMLLCVNLLDEAEKKQLRPNLSQLQKQLNFPVVGVSARSGQGLVQFKQTLHQAIREHHCPPATPIHYDTDLERGLRYLEPAVAAAATPPLSSRFFSLQLLQEDPSALSAAEKALGFPLQNHPKVADALQRTESFLQEQDFPLSKRQDCIARKRRQRAQTLALQCGGQLSLEKRKKDQRMDAFFTSRRTGILSMLLLFAFILWITLVGANYPSQLLSQCLFSLEPPLRQLLSFAPEWLQGALIDGMYRTAAWVVAVMLPPMAIFFPLFTLLEDAGYLPRVAFNLDHCFQRSGAHGRQALTMCMGLGCNACGVTGCRIIDSPRERMIAMLTNPLVPCNGRFPTLIAILNMFFITTAYPWLNSLLGAAALLLLITLAVGMTFALSWLLSHTVLRGLPSAFSLELPPYRRPQVGKVLLRSLLDRTLFVLGRSLLVAMPAGLLIWLLANVQSDSLSLLQHCAALLDPPARFLGLDGTILLAFLLGFPANEIVVPIMLMGYLSHSRLTGGTELSQIHQLLLNQGWTLRTALCMLVFVLFHFPCGTTTLTLYKESGSLRWTVFGFFLPLLAGVVLCSLLCMLWP